MGLVFLAFYCKLHCWRSLLPRCSKIEFSSPTPPVFSNTLLRTT